MPSAFFVKCGSRPLPHLGVAVPARPAPPPPRPRPPWQPAPCRGAQRGRAERASALCAPHLAVSHVVPRDSSAFVTGVIIVTDSQPLSQTLQRSGSHIIIQIARCSLISCLGCRLPATALPAVRLHPLLLLPLRAPLRAPGLLGFRPSNLPTPACQATALGG